MKTSLLLATLFVTAATSCKVGTPQKAVSSSNAASDSSTKCSFSNPTASKKPLDIPEDNRLLTSIATGEIKPEDKNNPEAVYNYLEGHWRKKFEEKPKDNQGHKQNSIDLIKKIATSLGCPNSESLAAEFAKGKFENIKIYTDESADPLGYQRDPIPNYQIMNQALRSDSNLSQIRTNNPKAAEMIEKMDQALASLPSVKGLVFRGTKLGKDLLASILKSGEMRDAAYVSTSIDIVDGFDFLQKATNSDTHQRVFMVIYGKSGKFLPFGQFSKEEEVLFPHGTIFKLRHSFIYAKPEEPNKSTNYLFLEEV